MMTPTASPPAAPTTKAARPRLRRRRLVFAGLGLALVAGWVLLGGPAALTNTMAARALAGRDLKSAAAWLDWSDRLGKATGRTEFLRARLARREQRYEAVREHLFRARSLGWPRESLEREQWMTMAQAGQMRLAEPHLAELLTDPRGDGVEICEAYVTGYVLTYQLSRAEVLLTAWEADYPSDPRPWIIHGGLHFNADKTKDAEQAYRRALGFAPGNSEAKLGLAESLIAQQQYAAAIDVLRQIPPAAPEYESAKLGVGRCLMASGKTDEARTELTTMTEQFPRSHRGWQFLGQLELEAGNYERAAGLLEKAVALAPGSIEPMYSLVTALRGQGRRDEAAALNERLTRLQTLKDETSRLTEVVGSDPGDVEARFKLGQLHLERENLTEGKLWLKSVLEFDPGHAGARKALEAAESPTPRDANEPPALPDDDDE